MTRTTARHARRTGPDRRVMGVVAALVVLVAVVTAVLVADGDDSAGTTPSEYGVVTTSGAVLPPLGPGGDPAVGATAPRLLSERPAGSVAVDPGETGPVMLVFLAHWCPHCQTELPEYVALHEEGAFDGIRTVAVLTATTPERPNHPPTAWLDREGWDGERLYDDETGTAAAAYGVTNFPFTVFVDADGAVTDRLAGGQSRERVLTAVEAVSGQDGG